MDSKDRDKQKFLQEKYQNILNTLLKDEDNKYCVDCDSKGPRWASWNIGVFVCIRCAGIHRNLGVHISKIKSVNLDSWTAEQVASMQQMGNSRGRAVYEANLPDTFRRPNNDFSLETFIRSKYEHKKFIAKEWVPPSQNSKLNITDELQFSNHKKSVKKKPVIKQMANKTGETDNSIVPVLPKPRPPGTTVSVNVMCSPSINATTKVQSKTALSSDLLLNLDKSDRNETDKDPFGRIFSVDIDSHSNDKAHSDSVKSTEEDDFFKQVMPPEKEEVKLTKDGIMALYNKSNNDGRFSATACSAMPSHSLSFPNNFTGIPSYHPSVFKSEPDTSEPSVKLPQSLLQEFCTMNLHNKYNEHNVNPTSHGVDFFK